MRITQTTWRPAPNGRVDQMQTYSINRPVSTHFNQRSCQEAQCAGHVNGWITTLHEDDPKQCQWAEWIRTGSGRRFIESRNEDGTVSFTFPPGQTCFKRVKEIVNGRPTGRYFHLEGNDRPPIFSVRGGDWRGVTSAPRRFKSGEDFVESFATNQQKIADRLQKG